MFTRKFHRFVWPALSLILLCAQFAAAQTVTGAISGTVVDASGAAVAGATVRLVNERTKDARVLTTNESGDFRFTATLPGTYTIKWELYNAFNHTQFSGVDTTARFDAAGDQVNTNFGRVTAAREPRYMQLSLRVTF
jgi:hypothetical protein